MHLIFIPGDFLSHRPDMLRSMKNANDTTGKGHPDETLEDLLAAAGLSFTVVDQCPEPSCLLCGDARLSTAA